MSKYRQELQEFTLESLNATVFQATTGINPGVARMSDSDLSLFSAVSQFTVDRVGVSEVQQVSFTPDEATLFAPEGESLSFEPEPAEDYESQVDSLEFSAPQSSLPDLPQPTAQAIQQPIQQPQPLQQSLFQAPPIRTEVPEPAAESRRAPRVSSSLDELPLSRPAAAEPLEQSLPSIPVAIDQQLQGDDASFFNTPAPSQLSFESQDEPEQDSESPPEERLVGHTEEVRSSEVAPEATARQRTDTPAATTPPNSGESRKERRREGLLQLQDAREARQQQQAVGGEGFEVRGEATSDTGPPALDRNRDTRERVSQGSAAPFLLGLNKPPMEASPNGLPSVVGGSTDFPDAINNFAESVGNLFSASTDTLTSQSRRIRSLEWIVREAAT